MTLTELADHLGIALIVDANPEAAEDCVGLSGASPQAQACDRGVLVTSIGPDTAYSICHEMAHLLTDCGDEARTFGAQTALAAMLDGDEKRRATPGSGDDVVYVPTGDAS